MKMHYYFLLNIKHGSSQLYLGAQIQLAPGGTTTRPQGRGLCEAAGEEGRGLKRGPGEEPLRGPQLSSSGTEYRQHRRGSASGKEPLAAAYGLNNDSVQFMSIH